MLVLTRTQASRAREREEQIKRGVARVNAAIDRARRRYITPIAGQEMIYREKESEALRYLALAQPPEDLAGFPFIAAESAATATDPGQVAGTFRQLSVQWRQVGAELEALRIGTIMRLRAADDAARIETELAEFTELLEALS